MERALLRIDDLRGIWRALSPEERVEGFELLPRVDAEQFFHALKAHDQARLLEGLPREEQRLWSRS